MEDASWLGYAGAPSSTSAIEETARRERYALFERVALATGSNAICVGHQADDNAETILHRIVRGTGLRGIGGIPARRRLRPGSDLWLVRPLLRFPRRKLLEFLADAGVPYREDESNLYPAPSDVLAPSRPVAELTTGPGRAAPMRNLIRNVVLPMLESQINPQVREALLRLGEQARWVEEHLAETVVRAFETLVISRSERELVLSARSLARRSRIIQAEVIRHAIASFHVGEQDLSFTHLSAVCDLLAGRTSGKQIQLPGGLTATKRYDRLILNLPGAPSPETIPAETAVHVPGRTVLPVRRLELICTLQEGEPQGLSRREGDSPDSSRRSNELSGEAPRSRFEESIDFDKLQLPLVVRRRRRGERFWPLGAPGRKKLSDFLVDAKVDPVERERVAVLCDQQGPIWIIGHRIDERVKLTDATRRILHIRVAPL
jgi:tRNA(Ile)-lysidine synthase